MPGASRNRSPVRGPSETETGNPVTASARDPGSCVTCRPGECRLGAGVDAGRHRTGEPVTASLASWCGHSPGPL